MKSCRGIFTALVTPFDASGAIDLDAFRRLLQRQKAAGVAGVVPCGTTGESPTLSKDEKKLLISTALEELKGSSLQVIPGTGTGDTRESVDLSCWASQQGADAVLVVTPYYNKPTQAGLFNHYKEIAEKAGCDVILYNVPGRTGVSLTAETVVQLAAVPGIRAIKEATGSLSFASEILDGLKQAGRTLALLSGDDPTFLPALSVGACGVISVASNLCPREMVQLHKLFDEGRSQEAAELHQRLYPVLRDLFVESNPSPVKFAMSLRGECLPRVRSPLVPLLAASETKVRSALSRAGLLEKA